MMDKNLVRFGIILFVFLIIFSTAVLHPPKETLKAGLDLAGGTSLIYEIDTAGLENKDISGLSQRMVPILLRRIDPAGVKNILMRPQGNSRLEIQIPLASADTRAKRDAFDTVLKELESQNVNLAIIRRSLSEPNEIRTETFEKLSSGSADRKEILTNLAKAYDSRKKVQLQRDEYEKQQDSIKAQLSQTGADIDYVEMMLPSWANMDANELSVAIEGLTVLDDDDLTVDKAALVKNLLEAYGKWAEAVNELTTPETGQNTQYRIAESALRNFNISVTGLVDVLEMPVKSESRAKLIDDFKSRFPEYKEKIDIAATVFEDYRPVRGRLDGPEDFKRLLKGAGVLEFRILPEFNDGKTSPEELQAYQEELKTKGPRQASSKYKWYEIEDIEDSTWRPSTENQIVLGQFAEKYYVLASNQKNESMHKLSAKRPWQLKKAMPTFDSRSGGNAISFVLDDVAKNLFHNLTRENVKRPLCILLDGIAISAPSISEAIPYGSGIITGKFTQSQQKDLADKLNAGSLPARLIDPPVSEKTIGPIIGADNRDKGIKAAIYGLAAVAVFMLVYYMLAGLLANVALFVNILFVLAIMALSSATFTLPGIAGIILTIGMSVDANVLIFERIREEQLRGSSLRIAITSGYQRAFRTILDANITTFGVALILYMVASEEIKGFSLTLMLGIASSMLTALFGTRVIFQLLLNAGIIKDHLLMMRLIKKPNFNWMAMRGVFFVISAVLVTGGLLAFYTRDEEKNSKYDIEFTGGTSVVIDLAKGTALDRADVEKLIHDKGNELKNKAIASARVNSIGTNNLRYEISTTETNKTTVEIALSSDKTQTAESVVAAIKEAENKFTGKLNNLIVAADETDSSKFIVQTSQVNKTLIKDVLADAFGIDSIVSAPVVDEIVSRAIKEAFANKLQVQRDLEPEIVSAEKITDSMVDKFPEIADFLGGIRIECNLKQPATVEQIRKRLNELRFKADMDQLLWHQYAVFVPDMSKAQDSDTLDSFIFVSIEPEAGYRELSADEWARFTANEESKVLAAMKLETSLPRVTQIDPSIGQESKNRAIVAIVLSLIGIVGYIWVRFGTARYGLAAIAALVHDVCITLGAIVACTYIADTPIGKALLISDFKIDLAMIAAFLTIIGYSLNDTIVVFDRIRENRGRLAALNPNIISNSINQTLSRTLLTSFTTFAVVLVMYIWGGAGLRGFTLGMLIGIVVGTYSSIAIAAPILIIGKVKKMKGAK